MFPQENARRSGQSDNEQIHNNNFSGNSNSLLTEEICKAVIASVLNGTKARIDRLITMGHPMNSDGELTLFARAMGVPEAEIPERIAGWRRVGIPPPAIIANGNGAGHADKPAADTDRVHVGNGTDADSEVGDASAPDGHVTEQDIADINQRLKEEGIEPVTRKVKTGHQRESLEPDRAQIEAYWHSLFKHAGEEGYLSLRAFHHKDEKPFQKRMWSVSPKNHEHIINVAVDMARRSANSPDPVVFCPPIAVFNNPNGWQAREEDLFKGLALSVECDERPEQARQTLQEVLGQPTVLVKSGGQWINDDDGEIEDKLHHHYRLAKKNVADHAKLKRARLLAARLVGGDPTSNSVVHPLRCPGSWHTKGQRRLCSIVENNPDIEIDLDKALLALEACFDHDPEAFNFADDQEPLADIERIVAALNSIPNPDLGWDEWNRIAMATWRASGGSQEGFNAFYAWSAKSKKHNPDDTRQRWQHYASSPPTKLGYGTLHYLAQSAKANGHAKPDNDCDVADTSAPSEAATVITLVAGNLHNIVTQAEAALIAAHAPFYARGGELVKPVVEEVPAFRGRRTKVARLRTLNGDMLRDYLSRTARFERFDKRADKLVPADPPLSIAQTLLSRDGEWSFPRLSGLITTPTLRPDGSILSELGYDRATGLLLLFGLEMPSIPEKPSRDDAVAALALLNKLLDEFPFVDGASRAVALSGLITPVVRGAMQCAPMHVFTAPKAGSGKSYGIDVASCLATGEVAPVIAAGRTEEETEKRLAAELMTGQSIISIDNLNGDLSGDFFCQAIERPIIKPRILGKSETVRIHNTATIFGNGNNFRLVGDTLRRAIVSLLDANMERPELRQFSGDPVATVLADRGRYVAAALTVVRAYLADGCPDQLPPLASFSDWSLLVRSPLVWLGHDDPVATMEKARAEDPTRSVLTDFVAAWQQAIGLNKPMTASDIGKWACSDAAGLLHKAASAVACAPGRFEIDPVRLGKWLGRHKGRVVGKYKVNGDRDRTNQTVWWLDSMTHEEG